MRIFNPFHSHIHSKGIHRAVAAFSAFAVGDAIFKYLTPFYDIRTLLFYSAVFNVLILVAAAPKLGGLARTFRGPDVKLHLLRGFILLAQLGAIIYAFTTLPMANTYALIFIAPFLTTLMSVFIFRERVGWRQWLAIGAGFGGVLLILRPGLVPLDLATLAALASATLFSASNLLARFIGRREQTLLSWGLLTELPILAVSAFLVSRQFSVPVPAHMLLILASSGLSVAGVILISRAFVLAPPSVAAPFHYVQMLWALFFGYLVFGDRLDLATALGSAVIIASGIWLLRLDEKPEAGTGEKGGQ
jgi:drug/metabolite transporter (DMT)-like permease